MKPVLLPNRHRSSIRRAPATAAALLATVLAGLPAAAEVASPRVSGGGAGKVPRDQIGLQLYSLRDQLARDVPATLDKVKGLGIRNVELAGTYGLSAAAFKALLDARGLSAVSAHFDYARLRDDIEGVLRDARTLGLQYVGGGWIPHDDKLPFDEKTMRAAIVVFNKAGEALASQGIKFFLHTHGYEFQPWQRGTLFDLLMAETKPEFVALQMDVFWIVHAGQDPVKLLERYGSRWQLMHLKGMKESTPTGLFTGHSAVTNCVPLGTGKIDYAPILRTARAVGVKWYFIEDESPAAEQQIPQSLRYLVAAMAAPSTPASGATVPGAAPSGAGLAGVPSSATSSAAASGAGGARAELSKVELSPLPPVPTGARTRIGSTLETVTVASMDRRVVYQTADHIEAPNWSRDGQYLLFNSGGRIYRLPILAGGGGGQPQVVDTGPATRCNNDHGLSPDGKSLVVSDQSEPGHQSRIYVLPVAGGAPRKVTPLAPSYWHGWSPDGATLAFCAERAGQYDVYTIPAAGGAERRLTTAAGLDDGPDYSPDGKFIYFNSERTGQMQIWRMKADGNDQEQVTRDEFNNWFPHPSPDGKQMVFLSYSKDVKGHPENKDVMLRLMPLGGGEARVLAKLFGGQGTINVPSWSPDSQRVAFVSYQPTHR